MTDTRAAVLEHLAAFNAHDTPRLLSGLTDGVRWETGRDVITGRAALAELFDEGLWALEPSLRAVRIVVDGDTAAVELVEHLRIDGELRTFAIAVFFALADGRIAVAKVYREGSADID